MARIVVSASYLKSHVSPLRFCRSLPRSHTCFKKQNVQRLLQELAVEGVYARREPLWVDMEQTINQSDSSRSSDILTFPNCLLTSSYISIKTQGNAKELYPLWRNKARNWTRKLPSLRRRKGPSRNWLDDKFHCSWHFLGRPCHGTLAVIVTKPSTLACPRHLYPWTVHICIIALCLQSCTLYPLLSMHGWYFT
jgi:hypothetical protein